MKLEFRAHRNNLIVRVHGELDMLVTDEFRKQLDNAMEKNCSHNLILNLEGVSFIDSSGLGVILGRYKNLTLRGGKVAIVKAPLPVKRILELSGILRIAGEYNSEEEALQVM